MVKDTIQKLEKEIGVTLEKFKAEIATIRTNRAQPSNG